MSASAASIGRSAANASRAGCFLASVDVRIAPTCSTKVCRSSTPKVRPSAAAFSSSRASKRFKSALFSADNSICSVARSSLAATALSTALSTSSAVAGSGPISAFKLAASLMRAKTNFQIAPTKTSGASVYTGHESLTPKMGKSGKKLDIQANTSFIASVLHPFNLRTIPKIGKPAAPQSAPLDFPAAVPHMFTHAKASQRSPCHL